MISLLLTWENRDCLCFPRRFDSCLGPAFFLFRFLDLLDVSFLKFFSFLDRLSWLFFPFGLVVKAISLFFLELCATVLM